MVILNDWFENYLLKIAEYNAEYDNTYSEFIIESGHTYSAFIMEA